MTFLIPILPGKWTPVSPAGTWPASALPVVLQIGLPRSRDLGIAEDAEIDVAARLWGRVSCSAFRAVVSGTTTVGPGDDGINGVYFEDTLWPTTLTPGAIATTIVHVDTQSNIYDTDILVNGAEHTFSLDAHGTTVDWRSIAAHELGHVLGLGESADPVATMYAAYPPGVSWRSLEQDDADGACTLYPGKGDALGCEATPCPTGFRCVARECQRIGDQRMTCSPCEPSTLGACEGEGDKARCVTYLEGSACGRPCTSTADCGAGFTCTATTQSGDYQCTSNSSCTTAEDTCKTHADCFDPTDAGWICGQSGACLGAIPADSGDAAPPDAGVVDVPRGGCNTGGGSTAWWVVFAIASPLLTIALRKHLRPKC